MNNINVKFIIFPTVSLREVYIRAIRASKVKWNYAVAFKDVNGYGLCLGVVDWAKSPYIQY